jgi:16S rRNA (cytosine967-C5)-methyltransferase
MDIHQYKLNNLKLRARRAGAHNIETRLIDSNKVIKKLHGSADRVLIDAPCTGLGVLRRNPDAKWKIDSDFLDRVVATQQEILQSYSKLVKVGGKIIYATCSILPQENDQQIEKFMSSEAGKKLQPHRKSSFIRLKRSFRRIFYRVT